MKDSTQAEQRTSADNGPVEAETASIREWDPEWDSIEDFTIKPEDAIELRASTGMEPYDVLALSTEYSGIAWVIDFGGALCAIFGLTEDANGDGIPWFIGSPLLEELNSIAVARATKAVVGEMETIYPFLHNYVMADYKQAVRWVRFLGFHLSDETFVLSDPERPFYYFWRYSDDV